MPKDFAARGRSNSRTSSARRTSPAKKSRAKQPRRNAAQRVLFHGPSFSFGALVGAAIVIVASYGPEFLESTDVIPQSAQTQDSEQPELEFEFAKILKESEVKPDPEPYAVPEAAKINPSNPAYLQAASFHKYADAEKLRAELLLDNLPARTLSARVEGKQWYRVVVGPFIDVRDTDRARNRLSEHGLFATTIYNPD